MLECLFMTYALSMAYYEDSLTELLCVSIEKIFMLVI
jgi:hypothetical protein